MIEQENLFENVTDEEEFYGSTILIKPKKPSSKTKYTGKGTITRVLNNGNVIEFIPEGKESAFRLSKDDYNIIPIDIVKTKQEDSKNKKLILNCKIKDGHYIGEGSDKVFGRTWQEIQDMQQGYKRKV